MATLTLVPNSGTVVENSGEFTSPTAAAIATGLADDGSTSVAVNGPVPTTIDVDTVGIGSYNITYTIPQNISGGSDEVAVETTADYTLTVQAAPTAPSGIDEFIDGTTDRFGVDTAGNPMYKDAVTNPPADEIQSSIFDENAMDPYELANANKNK